MKSTIKKIKQQQTIQPTKITKNRITALLLALLLVTTVLSPIIPVKAQETTSESARTTQNNGGTSAGAGDKLPVDDAKDDTTITTNEDGTRTLKFTQKIVFVDKNPDYVSIDKYSFEVNGKGKFIMVSYMNTSRTGSDDGLEVASFLLSNAGFTNKMTSSSGSILNRACVLHNGVYYSPLHSVVNRNPLSSATLTGFANMKRITLPDGYTYENMIERLIDSGTLDLSKDDYKEPNEASAVYNKSLDFASISADYKVKYTIEKNKDGHFEFITPDDAGIQFDWINRTDIDGAYVKFNLYGEYYDSFWSTTYTNTYVTLTCDRKNDLAFLCKQKDMLTQAKEKCNGSKGYGFVVNYIYVQAFANIDGTLFRSRIYKFDSDLVSDYGNADSEDDEWFPEITGGDSMPEEYEPDPENLDPEKTEPEPDKDDDTVVDTPVDNDPDVIINDDATYLEAFKQFINVMKQGISYLGDFPALVAEVFSFIPSIFILFIGIGFAVALVLRFLGR